ncbi:MAG: type IV pilin N-terminal domain-containing protein [Natrialbaceae archaeon]|nr:type IV pilin N-terminal domain-containing protein [Natrialbaceae archaeon]
MVRALSPLVGTITLVALTVMLATAIVVVVPLPSSSVPTAAFDLAADGDANELVFTHRAGDPIEVDTLTIQITVNGEPLAQQPPIPFVGAAGYYQSPGGPFNAKYDGTWTAGTTASLTIAKSNRRLAAGDTVTARLSAGGAMIADLEVDAD